MRKGLLILARTVWNDEVVDKTQDTYYTRTEGDGQQKIKFKTY